MTRDLTPPTFALGTEVYVSGQPNVWVIIGFNYNDRTYLVRNASTTLTVTEAQISLTPTDVPAPEPATNTSSTTQTTTECDCTIEDSILNELDGERLLT